MTFISAWKNNTSAFIVADSAITYEGTTSVNDAHVLSDRTTFNEPHISSEDNLTQEQWLKIVKLENNLTLAFAGAVKTAYNVIDILREYLEKNKWQDIQGSFKDICKKFGGDEISIIASFSENEIPVLISYNCNKTPGHKEHSIFEPVHGGKINNEFVQHTEDCYSAFKTSEYSDDEILISICSVFQSFRYLDNILAQGVGGFFSGIRVDNTAIQWQRDVAYIPFQSNGKAIESFQLSDILGDAELVTIVAREDLVYIGSPFVHEKIAKRPFGNYVPKEVLNGKEWFDKRTNWMHKWGDEVEAIVDDFNPDFFVFIKKTKPVTFTVCSKKQKAFVVEKTTSNTSFRFDPKMIALFLKSLLEPEDPEITLNHWFEKRS